MAWQPSTSHESSSLIAFPVPQMCVVVIFSLNLTLFLKFSSSYHWEVEEQSSLKSFWLWNYELSANSPSSGFKFAFRQGKNDHHTHLWNWEGYQAWGLWEVDGCQAIYGNILCFETSYPFLDLYQRTSVRHSKIPVIDYGKPKRLLLINFCLY